VAERTRGGALFPHNEYLRVFHDLGVIGLGALFAAFATVILALRKLHRTTASRTTRELALAALLCWAAFALISLFDNPLGYFVFFTHNVFLLTALAFRSAALEQTT
jgi:O-antigen ligase